MVCSSKRAAQISHNVSALAEQGGSGRDTHLPHIGGGAHAGSGGLRTQSEPTEAAGPKRAGRKKKTAAAYS